MFIDWFAEQRCLEHNHAHQQSIKEPPFPFWFRESFYSAVDSEIIDFPSAHVDNLLSGARRMQSRPTPSVTQWFFFVSIPYGNKSELSNESRVRRASFYLITVEPRRLIRFAASERRSSHKEFPSIRHLTQRWHQFFPVDMHRSGVSIRVQFAIVYVLALLPQTTHKLTFGGCIQVRWVIAQLFLSAACRCLITRDERQ